MLDRKKKKQKLHDVVEERNKSFSSHVCCSTRLDSLCSLSLSHSLRRLAPVYESASLRTNTLTYFPFQQKKRSEKAAPFGEERKNGVSRKFST